MPLRETLCSNPELNSIIEMLEREYPEMYLSPIEIVEREYLETHLSPALSEFKAIEVCSPKTIQLLTAEELLTLKQLDETLYDGYLKEKSKNDEINLEECPITLESLTSNLKSNNPKKFVLVELLENHPLRQNSEQIHKHDFVYDYNALKHWVETSKKCILPENRAPIGLLNSKMKELHSNPNEQTTNYEPLLVLIKKARDSLSTREKLSGFSASRFFVREEDGKKIEENDLSNFLKKDQQDASCRNFL